MKTYTVELSQSAVEKAEEIRQKLLARGFKVKDKSLAEMIELEVFVLDELFLERFGKELLKLVDYGDEISLIVKNKLYDLPYEHLSLIKEELEDVLGRIEEQMEIYEDRVGSEEDENAKEEKV